MKSYPKNDRVTSGKEPQYRWVDQEQAENLNKSLNLSNYLNSTKEEENIEQKTKNQIFEVTSSKPKISGL